MQTHVHNAEIERRAQEFSVLTMVDQDIDVSTRSHKNTHTHTTRKWSDALRSSLCSKSYKCMFIYMHKHTHTQNGAARSGADDTENCVWGGYD